MKLKKIILENWIIIAILVIATLLRFYRLHDLTTFSGDQGYDFLKVKEILEGNLTLLGPKIGPYNQLGNLYLGPAYYYLLAPALFLFRLDPIGSAVLTAVLSIGTIYVIYLIGINFFSKNIAVLSALLFAINPFLINQSKAASNPHLIPFFSSIAVFATMHTLVKKRKQIIRPLLSGFSLGIIFQLHYLAISLVIAVLITLLFLKNYRNITHVIAAFLLAVSPQIIFELRHDFFVTNLFIRQLQDGQSLSTFQTALENFHLSIKQMSQTLFLSGNYLLLFTPFFVSLIFLVSKKFKMFLFLPILFNLVLASLYTNGPSEHYFSTVYPHIVLIISVAFFTIFNRFNNTVPKIILSVFLILLIINSMSKLDLDNRNGYTMPQGWNLSGVKKASQIIASDVDLGKKFNVAATLDGDTRAMPYRYLLKVYGKQPLDVEHYPDAQILYLISREQESEIYHKTVWEIASFAPFTIKKQWPIQNGITLYRIEKYIN